MCAQFHWYLNKTGLRGLTGPKGDQGFSPIVEVAEDTLESYKLRITTEDDEIETPNLKGSLSIQDQGGTYVRYDRDSGELTANEADRATTNSYGVVRLSTYQDMKNPELQDNVAAQPLDVIQAIEERVVIETTDRIQEEGNLHSRINDERSARISADASIRESISTLSGSLQNTNSRVQNLTTDLATEKQVRLAADTQQQAQIDAERQEREIQDASLQNQLGTKLTADNIKAGDNVTITKDGNNVTINSTGGGVVPENIMTLDTDQDVTGDKTFMPNTLKISDGEYSINLANYNSNIFYTDPEKRSYFTGAVEMGANVTARGSFWRTMPFIDPETMEVTWVANEVLYDDSIDNQTIKLVDGKLHADFSEIGDEVNTLAGRMNTVENELGDLTERVDDLSLFKFPNATIIGEPTINNGQITDFSPTNYLQFPFEFETKGRTWSLNGSFHTGNNVTTQQNIIDSLASIALAVRNGRLVMALSTNGTTFDLGEHISMSDIEPNTTYFFRITFSGVAYTLSLSTDKIDYMPEAIVESSTPIASKPMTISSAGHPFSSIINLNDWDLTVANTLVWQGMDDVGIASRMDVNASNVTESGKENIREIAGVGDIGEALDLLNGGDSTLLSTKADVSFSNINDNAKQVIRDVAGGGSGGGVDTELSNTSENAVQNKVIKEALDLKADKSELDGQWVLTSIQLHTAVEMGTYTYDLSSYLPDDNSIYELIIIASGNSANSSLLSIESDIMTPSLRAVWCAANARNKTNIFTFLATKQIKLEISGTDFSSTCGLNIRGYRRVG